MARLNWQRAAYNDRMRRQPTVNEEPKEPPKEPLAGRARRQQEIAALQNRGPLNANQQRRLEQLIALEQKEEKYSK